MSPHVETLDSNTSLLSFPSKPYISSQILRFSFSRISPFLVVCSDFAGMARNLGFLALLLSLSVCICRAATFQPISDRHRSAALELFVPIDGSFGRFDDPDQNPNSIYFVFFIFFFSHVMSGLHVYLRFIYALRCKLLSVYEIHLCTQMWICQCKIWLLLCEFAFGASSFRFSFLFAMEFWLTFFFFFFDSLLSHQLWIDHEICNYYFPFSICASRHPNMSML